MDPIERQQKRCYICLGYGHDQDDCPMNCEQELKAAINAVIKPRRGEMDDNAYINANDLLDAAKDHYWDSLEHERESIIKHIEGIISCFITPKQEG
jgi:hypothetical protein